MTDEQRANLLLAIERAQNAGRCSYIAGCVIAQLADVVDSTGATRRGLEQHDKAGVTSYLHDGALRAVFVPYGTMRLRNIQDMWDNANVDIDGRQRPATPEQAEVARAKMREIVLAA